MTTQKLEGLKSILEKKPKVSHVYFNSEGDYMLHETTGYETKKSREEILESDSETKTDTLKKAADLIAEINSAETPEAVDALVGNDTRVTVLKAAWDKKQALTKTE